MTRADADARVARGMALLDQQVPGWESRIDLATLDIVRCHLCMLGQLLGSYQKGALEIGYDIFRNHRALRNRGFALALLEDGDLLNTAWRDAIVARRASA